MSEQSQPLAPLEVTAPPEHKFREFLAIRGEKLTEQRRVLIRHIFDSHKHFDADELVAEVNQGGEMVAAVIAEADDSVPVRQVRATRGKYLRAAPVAQLYEQNRVRHVGAFPALEDEMCAFGPDGLPNGASPDRLDALVWAIAALTSAPRTSQPRMRRV